MTELKVKWDDARFQQTNILWVESSEECNMIDMLRVHEFDYIRKLEDKIRKIRKEAATQKMALDRGMRCCPKTDFLITKETRSRNIVHLRVVVELLNMRIFLNQIPEGPHEFYPHKAMLVPFLVDEFLLSAKGKGSFMGYSVRHLHIHSPKEPIEEKPGQLVYSPYALCPSRKKLVKWSPLRKKQLPYQLDRVSQRTGFHADAIIKVCRQLFTIKVSLSSG